MPVDSATLRDALSDFAESLSSGPIGLARYAPAPGASHTNCLGNALDVAGARGGRVRFGWCFLVRESIDYGPYLVAVHHAVWHDPESLGLIDVTPRHPDPNHHPMTQGGDALFLVDDQAQPYEDPPRLVPLPSRFFAIGDDPSLLSYVRHLQAEEIESYNREHGSNFA